MDDEVIHKLLTANDPQGIELLFRRYYRPLVLRADSILNDIPASEDIVQNFFITFWKEQIYRRTTPGNLRAYIFMSIRNQALKQQVKRDPLREASREIPEGLPDNGFDWCREEVIQKLEREIEKLPPRMREILVSVYIDNLSYREAAEKFSISISTVKTMLVNALKHLRATFKQKIILFFHFSNQPFSSFRGL